MPIHGSGVALLIDRLSDLNFYDEFNHLAENTDVWTCGGDGGSFLFEGIPEHPTKWTLKTGNVIDNDYYIHGHAVKNNKRFTPFEEGYTAVSLETRVQFSSVADVSAVLGFLNVVLTEYSLPNISILFFVDTVLSNTFRTRTHDGLAEEATDTLVALDTDFHVFKILVTRASVLFYIDGVLVATHTANIPQYPLFLEFLIRTEAAASKNMCLDFVHVEVI